MNYTFNPSLVIFRENALEYEMGKNLYNKFEENEINIKTVSSKGPFPLDYDLPFIKKFHRAKKIIVVSVRSVNKFQTCKPSAHYQLPLVSGCPGHCKYCYLSTNLGKNPYVKIYVNLSEIFQKTQKYINERKPEITIFEGAATSDPIPVEKWGGSLSKAIKFFARNKSARFRFVTKFTEVDPLLKINHNQHTEFRFSLNTTKIIQKYEPTTPPLKERLRAASKVLKAGYPQGFLIAPIFIYDSWKKDYKDLFQKIRKKLDTRGENLSFELITHRYTERAKNIINQAYPENELPMEEEDRRFKYGQFGYGKYVYPEETMEKIEQHFKNSLDKYLPEAKIKYFV
ncbi:MAG: spore photoproduct lyase [Bacillota bacterium]